jgi:hypothetical protein
VTSGFWRAYGERAVYDSPWVWLGEVVDGEEPAIAANRERAGEIWSAASVAALPLLLMQH